MTGATQRVCAWCSDRIGETYVSYERHTAARHEATYFCGDEHLKEFLNSESS